MNKEPIIKSKTTNKKNHHWTFLSNHSHVIVCLHRDPEIRLKDISALVGITERAVQAIINDLLTADVLKIEKMGRRNKYILNLDYPLRHQLENKRKIGELLRLIGKD
ncbi:MAG: ArsR family transcriptional regulator [Leptospiraceae bacterium]|nr:ArsR family transcriptional regulator [Leptospiraceae bacterium]